MDAGTRKAGSRPHPLAAAFQILLAALLCGAVANVFGPRRIPWTEDWGSYIETKALKEGVPLVRTEQVRKMVGAMACLVLDARPEADYAAGHLPGAISLPYDEVEERLPQVEPFLTRTTPILAYCSGASCDESFLLTLYLRGQGFTNAVLYLGGFQEWKTAGHPVEGGP